MKFALAAFLALLTASLVATAAQAPLIAEGVNLRVNMVNQQPDPVAPGEKFDLRLKIENNGSTNAENVEIRLVEAAPFTMLEPATKNVGSIHPVQDGDVGVIVKYQLQAAMMAADGSYTFAVEYRYGSGSWIRKDMESIRIQSPVAIVTVAASAVAGGSIAPGKTGTVHATIRNGATSAIQDLTATLIVQGTAFSPINRTNVQGLNYLPGSGEHTFSYLIGAESSAASRIHPLILQLAYSDVLGKRHTQNATIGIPVFSPPRYTLALEDTKVHTPDATGEIVVSIADTGLSSIKFLTLELLDDATYEVLTAPRVYVGNLESDDFETAAFTIHTSKGAQTAQLRLRLTFNDDYDTTHTADEELALSLRSKQEAQHYGLLPPPPSIAVRLASAAVQVLLLVFTAFMLVDVARSSLPVYKRILWGVAVLTVAGAFIYYFAGRKKQ